MAFRWLPFGIILAFLVSCGVAAGPNSPESRPTSAPAATATVPALLPTLTGPPASTPLPSFDPSPTAIPPSPVPTPTPPPAARDLSLAGSRLYMLSLINAARSDAGVLPVLLGRNLAAQQHAEAQLSGCWTSHWNTEGLTTYMRYSLAGGYHPHRENVLGQAYCDGDRRQQPNIRVRIDRMLAVWLDSPGHRATLLDPEYRRVNIGLAWNARYHAGVQVFEGDYVNFDRLPSLEGGVLRFSGTVHGGPHFDTPADLWADLVYDPPPHALTRGQLARSSSMTLGRPVAALRPPAPPGRVYSQRDFESVDPQSCLSPYDVDAHLSAARSAVEAQRLYREARDACLSRRELDGDTFKMRWLTSSTWEASGDAFAVTVDLSPVLAAHGPGVYTLTLWDLQPDGSSLQVADYSLFYEVDLP